jgi:putative ABC transport system permease protein
MKYAILVLSNFKRHKTRTFLTVASITVAFILFAYLATIRKSFEMGVEVAGVNRLITRHRVSLVQLLPASYEQRIEQVEGVTAATPATWFGGSYKEERMPFPRIAVKPEEYLAMFPEFVLPEEQKQAWYRTKTGVIVGRKLAERFGFKPGSKIQIVPDIWWPVKGPTWEFDVVGVYGGSKKETDLTQMLLRSDYLDENRQYVKGQVGWYSVQIRDPNEAAAVSKRIDTLFVNSPAETKTATEAAFMQGWADQIGDIGKIIIAILTAVFITILLVAGNTMSQAIRERIAELGVLKAIGYTDLQMLALVLAESLAAASDCSSAG